MTHSFFKLTLVSGLALAAATAAVPAKAAATVLGGYFQEQSLKNCTNSSVCVIKFSAVPAGKVFVLRQVGCAVTSTTTLGAAAVTARLNNVLTGRSNYPIPTYLGTFSSVKRYNINSDMLELFGTNEVPEITLTTTTVPGEFVANCSISGEVK